MKKVGIMGGSFNPIHTGHLILAENAFEQAGLDKILFMPLKIPPHKDKSTMISDRHRINMVSLAIESNPHFDLSKLEIERKGTTYTVDTLRILTDENPDTKYYFIVGADSFLMMEKWKNPKELFDLATILVADREEQGQDKLAKHYQYLKKEYGARAIFIDIPNIALSSASIRERIKKNKSIRYMVPNKVWEYINKELNDQIIKTRLEDLLGQSRYQHSLEVSEVARDLAIIYNYEEEKAALAGILHDCAKYLSDDDLLDESIRNKLLISKVEKRVPSLLHGKVGAIYAREKYGVEDKDILNAISYHTTGRPGMSLLEKIIFIADYIEPSRKEIPEINKIRIAAYNELDKAVYMILNNTLQYLKGTGALIEKSTEDAFRYYKKKMKGDI